MIRKLTLAAVFGAGYVLGAKAGKERYAQIAGGLANLRSKPPVAKAEATATAKAADLADTAKDKASALAGDAVETVKGKAGGTDDPPIDDIVDLGPTPAQGGTPA